MLASIFPPIHREGYKFIAIFAGVALVSFLLWDLLGWLATILTVWCYYFFRDPERVTPDREGVAVSPADGVVCLVGPATPPIELELGDEPRERICVFMNVFNCHVNRVSMGGTIEKIAYRPGTFLNASLDKASENNERNSVAIRLHNGASIAVVQIAGLVARRILCEVTEGQKLATGDRFGLIRFGSRVDVYLPKGASPLAAVGQTMVAGETVIAEISSSEVAPASTMQ